MKINPQIAISLGEETCSTMQHKMDKVQAMQMPENETSLLDFIKTNYQKHNSAAPDYRQRPITFRTQINSDLVLVQLSQFKSTALRIHNSFSTAPDSKNSTLWTKYSSDGEESSAYVDTKQKYRQQMGEITGMFLNLQVEIKKIALS